MKVSSERLQDSQVLLQIEVEPERSAKSVETAYRRLVNRVAIPGFRKGRAPRHVVERIIGHDALMQEGIELLLPEVYREAVAETGIEPVDQPQVDIVQQQPLVVKVTVAVRPEVELGDYHDIHADQDSAMVREDEVEAVMQRLREEHAEWLPVDRAVATGDLANIDVVGAIRGTPVLYDVKGSAIVETDTGERVIDQHGVDYRVRPEHANPVEGFAEQVIGVQPGEEKRFELTFPPNYPNERVANKAVIFRVKVNGLKEQKLPDLDDELAKTVGDFATLDALRESVRGGLQQRKEREAGERLRKRVLDMVTDRARLELPTSLVEREIDRMVERVERRLRQADADLGAYLRALSKDKQQLRADFRADAIADLRHYFVLEEVVKLEHIDVTDEEVDAEIAALRKVMGASGRAEEALKSPERREDIARDIRHRKALSRLVSIATGEPEVAVPAGESFVDEAPLVGPAAPAEGNVDVADAEHK